MGSYLVRVIPQRGFETRRRSGVVFSVAGTVIGEAQMTAEIRSDPGLVVTAVADAEAAVLREALRSDEEAGAEVDLRGAADQRPQCAYPKANGEQCKGRALAGSRYCHSHMDRDGVDAGGATVLTAS